MFEINYFLMDLSVSKCINPSFNTPKSKYTHEAQSCPEFSDDMTPIVYLVVVHECVDWVLGIGDLKVLGNSPKVIKTRTHHGKWMNMDGFRACNKP